MPRIGWGNKLTAPISPKEFVEIAEELFPKFPLVVEERKIPAVPPPLKRRVRYADFEEAFAKKNDSRLHGFLKWFAANWVSRDFLFELQYEARIFIPYDVEQALLNKADVPAHPFGCYLLKQKETFHEFLLRDPQAAQMISARDLSQPNIKPVDAYAKMPVVNSGMHSVGTVVECGETYMSDLVLPLAARIVDQAMWVPFPTNHDLNTEWTDYGISCKALLIKQKRKVLAPFEQRQIARNALKAAGIASKTKQKKERKFFA